MGSNERKKGVTGMKDRMSSENKRSPNGSPHGSPIGIAVQYLYTMSSTKQDDLTNFDTPRTFAATLKN